MVIDTSAVLAVLFGEANAPAIVRALVGDDFTGTDIPAAPCPAVDGRGSVDRLPYHHDWEPVFTGEHGLRVKWFGRWRGGPDWSIESSRLAADLVCFFYLLDGLCTAAVNGAPVPMQPGELLVLRGAEVFSFTQDPSRPQTSLSACLALDVGTEANALLNLGYRRHCRLSDPKAYERRFAAVHDTMVNYQIVMGGDDAATATVDNFGVVPEPSMAAIMVLGGLLVAVRRRLTRHGRGPKPIGLPFPAASGRRQARGGTRSRPAPLSLPPDARLRLSGHAPAPGRGIAHVHTRLASSRARTFRLDPSPFNVGFLHQKRRCGVIPERGLAPVVRAFWGRPELCPNAIAALVTRYPARVILCNDWSFRCYFYDWNPFQFSYGHHRNELGWGNVGFVDGHVQYLKATRDHPDFQHGPGWTFVYSDYRATKPVPSLPGGRGRNQQEETGHGAWAAALKNGELLKIPQYKL